MAPSSSSRLTSTSTGTEARRSPTPVLPLRKGCRSAQTTGLSGASMNLQSHRRVLLGVHFGRYTPSLTPVAHHMVDQDPTTPRDSSAPSQVSSAWNSFRSSAFGPICATLKHMSEVGIRALKRNASAVVAEAAAGETVTITDRGRPVARMTAIPRSRLRALIDEGRARPARCRVVDLPDPEPGPDLSRALREMRSHERY